MLLRAATAGRVETELIRLGTSYGGWWVPTAVLRAGACCYCAGAGEDISFDACLAERYACRVVTFDPTPRATEYVKAHTPAGNFTFVDKGLAGKSATYRFYAPANPGEVSHSIRNLQRTEVFFEAACITVADAMELLGDDRIDLLKLDIEGAEHDVVADLLGRDIQPAALCMEFDQPCPPISLLRTVWSLRRAGYRPAKVERFNVTFVSDAVAY
jgi:FkbM family methyltransferase